MRFLLTCLMSALAPLSLYAQSNAPNAFDFLPVVQGGPSEVDQLAKVSIDPDKDIIRAATAQDAINAAVDLNEKELKENVEEVKQAEKKNEAPQVGAHLIHVNGYLGIVATGVGLYDPSENETLARISKRQAYIKAFMMAKKNLARKMYGLDNEGKNMVRTSMASLADDVETLNNLTEESIESIQQSLDEMLRGFVIYEVNDDQKQQQIRVSVVSTPKTRGQLARKAPHRVKAENLTQAVQEVINEIRLGLCPPVGGRIIEVAQTGETAFVGFGSAVVRDDSNAGIQARLNLQANRQAEAFAIDSLCGLIIGDQTAWKYGVTSKLTKEIKRFEEITKKDPLEETNETEIRKLEQERVKHVNKMEDTDLYQSARKGKLPPGVATRTWLDDDNAWAYGMAVYIPSVSNAAARAGKQTRDAKIVQDVDDNPFAPEVPQPKPQPSKGSKVKRPTPGVKKGVSGKVDKDGL